MDESNAFTKRHVEEVTAARKTLLDELSLPPKIKNYIRKNSRFLLVSFILILTAIFAWNYYSSYKASRDDQAAQELSQAMLMTDQAQKAAALEKIAADFSGTGSALWAQLTLAGDYMEQKEYAQAIAILQSVEGDVQRDNPLFPLLQQFTGVAHELSGELDKALSSYDALASLPGFAAQGHIASARVYELLDQPGKAKEAYEKANTANNINPDQRAWIQGKINSL